MTYIMRTKSKRQKDVLVAIIGGNFFEAKAILGASTIIDQEKVTIFMTSVYLCI